MIPLGSVSRIARKNAVSLLNAFRRHGSNDDKRKIVTVAVVFVWVMITVGVSYGVADRTQVYDRITIFVFIVVARQWGIELGRNEKQSEED